MDEKALNEIIALEQSKLGSFRDDNQKWKKKLLVQLFNSAGRQLDRILADPAAILEIRERDSNISEFLNLTMGVGENQEGDDDPDPEVADSKVIPIFRVDLYLVPVLASAYQDLLACSTYLATPSWWRIS